MMKVNNLNYGKVQSFGNLSWINKITTKSTEKICTKVRQVRKRPDSGLIEIISPEFNGILKFTNGILQEAKSNGITRTYDNAGKLLSISV